MESKEKVNTGMNAEEGGTEQSFPLSRSGDSYKWVAC